MLPYAQTAKQGSLRIIAIASPQRASGVLAEVPTWKEHGVNVVQDSFRAVMGAKDLSSAQIAYWDSVFSALARSTQWKMDVENNHCVNNYQPSAEARRYLASQYDDFKNELKNLGFVR